MDAEVRKLVTGLHSQALEIKGPHAGNAGNALLLPGIVAAVGVQATGATLPTQPLHGRLNSRQHGSRAR